VYPKFRKFTVGSCCTQRCGESGLQSFPGNGNDLTNNNKTNGKFSHGTFCGTRQSGDLAVISLMTFSEAGFIAFQEARFIVFQEAGFIALREAGFIAFQPKFGSWVLRTAISQGK
jgi:hypothetical protein